jgi:hypothetical protein
MIKTLLTFFLLLILGHPVSAQLWTRPEIESMIGSKQSFSRAEVIELFYEAGVQIGTIIDEEIAAAKTEIQADAEARFENWKAAYSAGLAKAEADARAYGLESALLWTSDAVLGLGLIIYGIVKADPAIIATGGLMAGASAFRLVIAIK